MIPPIYAPHIAKVIDVHHQAQFLLIEMRL
jgi:hypothetical protein